MQNNLAPVSQTNSQSSPTLNRCKDPEKGREDALRWNKESDPLWREIDYLVSFGLFLRSVLKGTVRTSLNELNKIKDVRLVTWLIRVYPTVYLLSTVWSEGGTEIRKYKTAVSSTAWYDRWQCSALWGVLVLVKSSRQRNTKSYGIGSQVSEIQSDTAPLFFTVIPSKEDPHKLSPLFVKKAEVSGVSFQSWGHLCTRGRLFLNKSIRSAERRRRGCH